MNTLDFAKFYIEKDWSVFPLQPHGKFPIIPAAHEKGNSCKGECGKEGHGLHDATKDITKVAEWISRYPDCNIGIATGQKSGFFVVDIDTGHNGENSLSGLIEKYGELPKTPISNTGGGGRHILFSSQGNDVRNTAGRLGMGIDTRGDGGYICAPNSTHPSGRIYSWDQTCPPSKVEISQPPEWLLFMLHEEKQAIITGQSVEGAYITGQRNNALTSLAGTMRRRGMTEEAIFLALNAENLNKCVPPLSESEVRLITASTMRYAPQTEPQHVQSRDRVTAEWSFAKCVYESPDDAIDYQNIQPDFFATDTLRDFWKSLLSGIDPATSATNAGILTELEHYQDFFMPRLEGYAKQIAEFGRTDKIVLFSENLRSAAQARNWDKVDRVIVDINKGSLITDKRAEPISNAWDEFEIEVQKRFEDKKEVWGIPYAWNKISKYTGGKQPGELVLFAGEPKIGKSWWCLQDALETAYNQTPVLYWSGEMKRKQIVRRLASILGLDSHRSRTGYMTENDWQSFQEAKSILYNIPFYIDDKPLSLAELRPMIKQKVDEYGIKQVVVDYAMKVRAHGKDEIEQSANISREIKDICNEFGLSIILIASVNKGGAEATNNTVTKASVRGSFQQIHDADVIYTLTKYKPADGDYSIQPARYDKIVTLNIQAGRELNQDLVAGYINYERETASPKFKEL